MTFQIRRFAAFVVVAAVAAIGLAKAAEDTRGPQRSAYRYGANEVCRDLDFYESLKPTVPILLRLNRQQAESWHDVEGALVDARKPIDAGCGKLKTLPESGSATAQAARLEVALASSLDALRRVRPSFDRFYAKLDQGQRRQVDKMFENYSL
jgi:hypothetical protein